MFDFDLFDTGDDLELPEGTKLFIRACWDEDGRRLTGFALTTTNSCLLTDDQILTHYRPDVSGRVIKADALEAWGVAETEWGNPL